ncbi:MAG: multidrug ABC transporter ATP-binding protein [Rickettsiales bacterium]|nr:MAG: multidrug ABC transporter ATP-binding protein [Rickettsiales bacterium]
MTKQLTSEPALSLGSTLRKCAYFLFRKQKLQSLFLVFLIVLSGIIPSVDSLFLQNITDAIEGFSDKDLQQTNLVEMLFKWVIIYALWWEGLNILWRVYDYAYLKIMPKIKAQVIDEFYDHIQHHSHEFFQNNLAGDISNRITEASRSLEMVFAFANEKIIRKLSVILFAMLTLYSVHIIIASIFLAWVVLFVGSSLLFARTINNYSTIYGKDKALVAGKIVDSISNISAIRMFASHRFERRYITTHLTSLVKSDQSMQWFMFKLRYFLGTSCTLMICAMIFYIITLRSNLDISIGQCVLVITLCLAVIADTWDLTQEFGDLFEQVGSFNQSMSLLEKCAITDHPDAKPLIVKEPRIEFQNVTFKYYNNSNSFNNKSLIITPCERIGLVGFSGSGKSTFTSLISRLYEIESGKIMIDGQDISKVSLETLRQNISIIPQEPILFHRSIRENIAYGKLGASDEEIRQAAKSAHIDEFITNLPKGYDTICGERGNNFSGGQRQRIVIARALLKEAPILILDEATNSLDTHTEKLIQSSLQQLMEGKTVLVIAHRLSTLLHMDRILVFDKGHVVEDGTHAKLRKNADLYKTLWDNY